MFYFPLNRIFAQKPISARMPRLSSTALADYNFDARRFCASMILMTVPDPSHSMIRQMN